MSTGSWGMQLDYLFNIICINCQVKYQLQTKSLGKMIPNVDVELKATILARLWSEKSDLVV